MYDVQGCIHIRMMILISLGAWEGDCIVPVSAQSLLLLLLKFLMRAVKQTALEKRYREQRSLLSSRDREHLLRQYVNRLSDIDDA